MKWPINPNKHRSRRKHADEFSNLGLNIMTARGAARQSTKVGDRQTTFTDPIMPCWGPQSQSYACARRIFILRSGSGEKRPLQRKVLLRADR